MASMLIRAGYVVCRITDAHSAAIIVDGAVYQCEGEIIEIGPYTLLHEKYPTVEVVGGTQFIAIPGLVNDHFHVGLSPFELGIADLPLELWGAARIGARSVNSYFDQLWGAIAMIESGTTTVQVLHTLERGRDPVDLRQAEVMLAAYEAAGMRASYAPPAADQNLLVAGPGGGEREFLAGLPEDLRRRFKRLIGRNAASVQELIACFEEIYLAYQGKRKVRIMMAPSNVHRCSDSLLVALKRLSEKFNSGMHLHVQETYYQHAFALQTWGKTGLQHLASLGVLDSSVTCGHGVWLTREDVELAARMDLTVCHNPSSNLRLGSGIAPIGPLMERGVRIALGTDEAGLNDDKDMFQEMRLALTLHRGPGIEHAGPTAHQVLQMATQHASVAAGFGAEVGFLAPGKRADIVLLNKAEILRPDLEQRSAIVEAVVQRGRAADVDTVIIDGDLVMSGRHLTRIDKTALRAQLDLELQRPLSQEETSRRQLAEELEPYLRQFYHGPSYIGCPHCGFRSAPGATAPAGAWPATEQ